MKHLLRLTFLLFTFAFLASCNKDDETPPPTPADLLSGKQWVITAWTVDPPYRTNNNTFISDVFGFYSQQGGGCILDDIRYFNFNGTYTFEEGASKCDPTDPTIWESGTWLFNSDGTAVITNSYSITLYGNTTTSLDINELTATNLSYTFIEWYGVQNEDETVSYFPRTHTQSFIAQ
jgi:hypothetical protein